MAVVHHIVAAAPTIILGSTMMTNLAIVSGGLVFKGIKALIDSEPEPAEAGQDGPKAMHTGGRIDISIEWMAGAPRPPLGEFTEENAPYGKRIIEGIARMVWFKGYPTALIETREFVALAPMEEDEAHDLGEDAKAASEQMRRVEFGVA